MGQRCGVPNRTRPWPCQRRVSYPPCWQHRGGGISGGTWHGGGTGGGGGWNPPGSDLDQSTSDEVASVLADVLTGGVRPTLADRLASRVVDYMGPRWRLPKRWGSGDCRLLAETARAVLDLKRKPMRRSAKGSADCYHLIPLASIGPSSSGSPRRSRFPGTPSWKPSPAACR